MTRRQIVLALVFALACAYAVLKSGSLQHLISNSADQVAELEEKLSRLDKLKSEQADVQDRLEKAVRKLSDHSQTHLPHPRDPLSWVRLQFGHIANQSGLEIVSITEQRAPRTREPRGEHHRQFKGYRVQVEVSASLSACVDFLELAESRNPHLILSDLYLGPAQIGSDSREGHIQFDWPVWIDTARDQAFRTEPDTSAGAPVTDSN